MQHYHNLNLCCHKRSVTNVKTFILKDGKKVKVFFCLNLMSTAKKSCLVQLYKTNYF